MKLVIHSTEQIVEIVAPGSDATGKARIWVGETESGIPVQLAILLVAVTAKERQDEFVAALHEKHAPEPADLAFPLRMLL